VNDGSDGPQTGPVGERAGRSGKPPVPRPVSPDLSDGQHRTEQVPFPLPPLPPQGVPDPAPETGRLFLGGYPPRVPGAAGRRPGAERHDPAPGNPGDDMDPGSDAGGRRGE
jgi:hypothetical protein